MKEILGYAFILLTVFTMTACGQTKKDEKQTVKHTKETQEMEAEFNFETKSVMLNSGVRF